MHFCVNAVSSNAPNRVACCKRKENKQTFPQLIRRGMQLQALLAFGVAMCKRYRRCENNNKRCENKKCNNITRGLALQISRDCRLLLHKLDVCLCCAAFDIFGACWCCWWKQFHSPAFVFYIFTHIHIHTYGMCTREYPGVKWTSYKLYIYYELQA